MEGVVRYIRGDHKDARRVLNWLVDIYNAEPENFDNDYFEMRNPKSVLIIYDEGVGGIVLDYLNHAHYPEEPKFICHYLSIEKKYRGLGLARNFVKIAKLKAKEYDTEFIGAYVDSPRQMDIWTALGFGNQGNVHFSVTMTVRPMNQLWGDGNE